MSENEDLTDKELNFKALREEKDALKAQLAELQPLKVAQTVRAAGFDPDTPAGKALSRLTDASSDVDAVKSLAAELGFNAEDDSPAPQLSKEERAAQEFAGRASELASATTSNQPPNLQTEIAEAEKAGDWNKAVALKLQSLHS